MNLKDSLMLVLLQLSTFVENYENQFSSTFSVPVWLKKKKVILV